MIRKKWNLRKGFTRSDGIIVESASGFFPVYIPESDRILEKCLVIMTDRQEDDILGAYWLFLDKNEREVFRMRTYEHDIAYYSGELLSVGECYSRYEDDPK